MRMRHLPGATGEIEGKKEQEQEADHPEREVEPRRGEQRAGTGRHPQRPKEIARARPESKLPGRPKTAALPTREERAPDHLGVDRPRRPGHRPAEHETVYDRRRRKRVHR